MSVSQSNGNQPRKLVNRRQHPVITQDKGATGSVVDKPAVTAGSPSQLPPVDAGKANLVVVTKTPEDTPPPLKPLQPFLDSIGTDASQGDKAGGDIEIQRPAKNPKDKPAAVSEDAFEAGKVMVGKQRPPAPKPIESDFGEGVYTAVDKTTGRLLPLDRDPPVQKVVQLPRSLVKAEATPCPMGEIVDQLYKDKEDATKKALSSSQSGLSLNPATPPKPDTSQDEKIALQTQIEYHLDDIEFMQKMERRTAALIKQYPKSKAIAELKKNHQLAADQAIAMAYQVKEYQQAYAEKYDLPTEPLKKDVEKLAKQGQGGKLGPQPAPKQLLQKPVERTDHGGGTKGLKERYKKENPLPVDTSHESDNAAEESESEIDLLAPLKEPPVKRTKKDAEPPLDDDAKIGKGHKKKHLQRQESVVKIPAYDDHDLDPPNHKNGDDATLNDLDDLLDHLKQDATS